MLYTITYYLISLIDIYQILLVAYIIISWLQNLNILSFNNRFFILLYKILFKICDPTLSIVRRNIPIVFANMDFAPVIVFIALEIFKMIIFI